MQLQTLPWTSSLLSAVLFTTTLSDLVGATGTSIVTTIPAAATVGPVIAEYVSGNSAVDAPKLSAYNSTVFDWWYFDAISSDLTQGLFLTFNLALATGVSGGNNESIPFASIYGIWPNQTLYLYSVPGTSAVVESSPNQATRGTWEGTGFSWVASPDMETYTVTINSTYISGTLSFESKAPAHYPCGAVEPGSDLVVAPSVGWTNAVPDADASVSLSVGGTAVEWSGIGYHDKNWGTEFFGSTFNSWYWGHVRIGPYSVVWFSVLAPGDRQYLSGYVAKDREVINASCGPGSVIVRPVGTPYPRGSDPNWPLGYHISIGIGEGKTLNVTVEQTGVIISSEGSRRLIGRATGSVNGGLQLEGYGQWEELWQAYE
ncbi:unnamed protein product [Clonostachys byssicola]|uniref:Hydroxyneurosporene synthase n=1 Tax=Clonostachys byssicola TaxID=160290 RepID=A0A9N9U8Z0_9HYPO|nr:unnamed protein product [Clonostachys byssicola]